MNKTSIFLFIGLSALVGCSTASYKNATAQNGAIQFPAKFSKNQDIHFEFEVDYGTQVDLYKKEAKDVRKAILTNTVLLAMNLPLTMATFEVRSEAEGRVDGHRLCKDQKSIEAVGDDFKEIEAFCNLNSILKRKFYTNNALKSYADHFEPAINLILDPRRDESVLVFPNYSIVAGAKSFGSGVLMASELRPSSRLKLQIQPTQQTGLIIKEYSGYSVARQSIWESSDNKAKLFVEYPVLGVVAQNIKDAKGRLIPIVPNIDLLKFFENNIPVIKHDEATRALKRIEATLAKFEMGDYLFLEENDYSKWTCGLFAVHANCKLEWHPDSSHKTLRDLDTLIEAWGVLMQSYTELDVSRSSDGKKVTVNGKIKISELFSEITVKPRSDFLER